MDYLGPLGGLVPIDCPTTLQPSHAPRTVTRESIGGVRRASRLPRVPSRIWDVDVEVVTPAEVDKIQAFADGSYGPGPWAYVSAEARKLNVLTPWQADFTRPLDQAYAPAGPIAIRGERFPASAVVSIPTGWRALADDIPVVLGIPVTVSMWVQSTSTPQMTVVWRLGTALSQESSTVTGTAGGQWQRLTWTGTPGPGVTAIRIGVRSSVSMVAAPQVTWTSGPVSWAAGRGAAKVVVTEHQAAVVTLAGPHYYDLAYRIEEIGE